MRDRRARMAERPWTVVLIGLAWGMLLGLVAQLLRRSGGDATALGGATVVWVVAALLPARHLARRPGPGGLWTVWAGIIAYLTAWLWAYHLAFMVWEGVPWGWVWNDARPWFVVLAPAAVVLTGLVALSRGTSRIADLAIIVPLAAGIAETWSAASNAGAGPALWIGVPTITLSSLPLIADERRLSSSASVPDGVVPGDVGGDAEPAPLPRGSGRRDGSGLDG